MERPLSEEHRLPGVNFFFTGELGLIVGVPGVPATGSGANFTDRCCFSARETQVDSGDAISAEQPSPLAARLLLRRSGQLSPPRTMLFLQLSRAVLGTSVASGMIVWLPPAPALRAVFGGSTLVREVPRARISEMKRICASSLVPFALMSLRAVSLPLFVFCSELTFCF